MTKNQLRTYLEVLTINETFENEERILREEMLYNDLEESKMELIKLGINPEDLEDFDY